MKIAAASVVVLFTALAGCANLKSPEDLAREDDEYLIRWYSYYAAQGSGHEKIEAELRRRDAFTPEEWTMIENRRVGLGASPNAVLAIHGNPSTRGGHYADGVNIRSWFYRDGPLITFENDRVTSITW